MSRDHNLDLGQKLLCNPRDKPFLHNTGGK